MSNPEQFRAETAIGLVKPFHRVECRCKACIAWLQIELCKQWAEVWRLKGEYDEKCDAYHEVVTNYGPAINEAKRLRAKASGLETENQTLLVRIENRDTKIRWLRNKCFNDAMAAKKSGFEEGQAHPHRSGLGKDD